MVPALPVAHLPHYQATQDTKQQFQELQEPADEDEADSAAVSALFRSSTFSSSRRYRSILEHANPLLTVEVVAVVVVAVVAGSSSTVAAPAGQALMTVVSDNACGQVFTFRISKAASSSSAETVVEYVGPGDLHPTFDTKQQPPEHHR